MADDAPLRSQWYGYQLGHIADEPFVVSLVRYRASADRKRAHGADANLVSSHLLDSPAHAPILDLDGPHRYVPSSTPGHGHLYLDQPMPRVKMWAILAALRWAGVIESGFFWWSLRRGGTFVRPVGITKDVP